MGSPRDLRPFLPYNNSTRRPGLRGYFIKGIIYPCASHCFLSQTQIYLFFFLTRLECTAWKCCERVVIVIQYPPAASAARGAAISDISQPRVIWGFPSSYPYYYCIVICTIWRHPNVSITVSSCRILLQSFERWGFCLQGYVGTTGSSARPSTVPHAIGSNNLPSSARDDMG